MTRLHVCEGSQRSRQPIFVINIITEILFYWKEYNKCFAMCSSFYHNGDMFIYNGVAIANQLSQPIAGTAAHG